MENSDQLAVTWIHLCKSIETVKYTIGYLFHIITPLVHVVGDQIINTSRLLHILCRETF